MPNWMSYAYCEKCDRPLKSNQIKTVSWSGAGEASGNDFLCKYCNGKCWKVGPMGWIGALCVVGYIVGVVLSTPDFAFEGFPLFLLGIGCGVGYRIQMRKCKPIYDRWVHQHGTAPDKWPNASRNQNASPSTAVESCGKDQTLISDQTGLSDHSVREQRRAKIGFGIMLATSLPIALWLYYQLNQIPSDVGLLEQYCYDCQKVVETRFDYNGRGEEYRACAICGNPTWFKLLPILCICVLTSVIALAGYSAIMGKPKWLRGNKHSN